MSRLLCCLFLMSLGAGCAGQPSTADGGLPDAGAEADASFLTGDCNTDRNRIAGHVEDVLSRHRAPCQNDSDCAFVERTIPCYQVCAGSVLATSVETVRAELVRFGEEVCPNTCRGWADCMPFDQPICNGGFCRHGFADGGVAF